ncbi:hypothetical protein [Yoonia sp. SS1-5]|uniref:Uncharacterized protein n=1 Tax=Yoonia rhodophyticola TaxID=3137370 RepID=A0AAN0NH66_9RHOB
MGDIVQFDVRDNTVRRIASEAYAGPLQLEGLHAEETCIMLALMDRGHVSGCVALSLDAADRLRRSLERSIEAMREGQDVPVLPSRDRIPSDQTG